jgi:hypothetical protein
VSKAKAPAGWATTLSRKFFTADGSLERRMK